MAWRRRATSDRGRNVTANRDGGYFGLRPRAARRYAPRGKRSGNYSPKLSAITMRRIEASSQHPILYVKWLCIDSDAYFNREPNAFLVEVARGRQPGVKLDYGMGQGRNAIYLAGLGWDVGGLIRPREASRSPKSGPRNWG